MANEFHETYGPDGLHIIMAISSQPSGNPSTLEYCAAVREKYDLGDIALCDLPDELAAYGKNSMVMLIDATGTIVYKKAVVSHSGLAKAIEAALP